MKFNFKERTISLLIIGVFSFIPMILLAQGEVYTNDLGMEFVLIEPGSMVVGRFMPTVTRPDPNNPGRGGRSEIPEELWDKAEKMALESQMPGFTVNLEEPYYIGKYEVTQEQWEKVMGNNPSSSQGDWVTDDPKQHPVETVTWDDVQEFIKRINNLDKTHVYRLPTEFEWEYAARAGATDDISWDDIRETAVLGGQSTSKVGTKIPNAWGIYDMLGNVWEWTQDVYNEKIFADPVPPKRGDEHVIKGSAYTGDVKNATYMTHAAGPGNGFDIGFRLVMEVN